MQPVKLALSLEKREAREIISIKIDNQNRNGQLHWFSTQKMEVRGWKPTIWIIWMDTTIIRRYWAQTASNQNRWSTTRQTLSRMGLAEMKIWEAWKVNMIMHTRKSLLMYLAISKRRKACPAFSLLKRIYRIMQAPEAHFQRGRLRAPNTAVLVAVSTEWLTIPRELSTPFEKKMSWLLLTKMGKR